MRPLARRVGCRGWFFACSAGLFFGLALWPFLDLLVVRSVVGLLAFPWFVSGLFGLVFWPFLALLVVY